MAVLLVGLPSAAAAQPQSVIGSISGSVDTKNLKTGSYAVRLRDVVSGQVLKTEPLSSAGQYSFTQLPLGQKYMVELVDTATNKVLATQGPYLLSSATSIVKSGVMVSTVASKIPAAMWLLAAGAGSAATVSAATASGSR